MSDVFEQLRRWIEAVILELGYPGIALVMLLENVIPPIPSELVMPFAGFLSSTGQLNVVGVLVAGTIGAVLGALVLYALGAWAGEPLLRAGIRRYGWLLRVDESSFDRSLALFARYGSAVVFFGRLLPLVRSLISLPAGMQRMPLGPFLFYTTLGSALWNGVLAGAGFVLGTQWARVLGFVARYEEVFAVAVVVGVGVALVARTMRSRRTAATR